MDEKRLQQKREAHRRWSEKNPEKMKASRRLSMKKWRDAHLAEARAKTNKWGALNPDRVREHKRAWKKRNPEACKISRKAHAAEHIEERREYLRKWRLSNLDHAHSWRKEWDRNHAGHLMMRRVVHALLRSSQSRRTVGSCEYIGCSPDFLRNHIEAQFRTGMTWENYGAVWHVDHVVPLAIFPFKEMPELLFVASHWSNLQPLLAGENLSKGARSGRSSARGAGND